MMTFLQWSIDILNAEGDESDQTCINNRALTGVMIIAASAVKVDTGVLARIDTRYVPLIRLLKVVSEDTE